MTGAELRCYEGPVLDGEAVPFDNPILPSRIGNGKSAGILTCGFISFHDLSRPGEGCGNP